MQRGEADQVISRETAGTQRQSLRVLPPRSKSFVSEWVTKKLPGPRPVTWNHGSFGYHDTKRSFSSVEIVAAYVL